jgi:hypothetical protein
MTLQLLHSEFPYMCEENLIFFFISVGYSLEVSPTSQSRSSAGGLGDVWAEV